MKRNNVEEALYEKKKKEKRKINWAETFEEFDDEYPGWSFTSLMILGILCFIVMIYLIYYSITTNPWILLYVLIGFLIIFFGIVIRKIFKCAQYDDD